MHVPSEIANVIAKTHPMALLLLCCKCSLLLDCGHSQSHNPCSASCKKTQSDATAAAALVFSFLPKYPILLVLCYCLLVAPSGPREDMCHPPASNKV